MTTEFWLQVLRSAPIDWLESSLSGKERFLVDARKLLAGRVPDAAFRETLRLTEEDVRLMKDELARRKRG